MDAPGLGPGAVTGPATHRGSGRPVAQPRPNGKRRGSCEAPRLLYCAPGMRIAFLLPDLCLGGAERATLDLAAALQRLGHAPELLLMRATGELLAEAEARFPVAALAVGRVRELARALGRTLSRNPPDALVAAMWPLTVVAPLARWRARTRCPVIVSEHGVLSRQYAGKGPAHAALLRTSLAVGLRAADARVGVAEGVVADMARLSGLPRSRMAVIPNPVPAPPPPSPDARAAAEALWGTKPGGRILSVGRLKPEKNHGLLLAALARLPEDLVWRLVLAGTGPSEALLRAKAQALGLGSRVTFAGMVPDPSALYASADLFVLSSDHEGFGIVLVEALHAGLPIVATDCPTGPREVLEGGAHGRLVPPRDAAALARAIVEALAAPRPDPLPLRRRAGDFAPETVARAYLALLAASTPAEGCG